MRGVNGRWCIRGCDRRRLLAILAAVIGCAALLAGVPSRASAAPLASATWTASDTTTGTAGVSYTYTVIAGATSALTEVTMTVPSDTGGTPAVGSVTPSSIAGGAVSLAGTTLGYTFSSVSVPAGTVLSIQVTGLDQYHVHGQRDLDDHHGQRRHRRGHRDGGLHFHRHRAYWRGLDSVVYRGRRIGHGLHLHVPALVRPSRGGGHHDHDVRPAGDRRNSRDRRGGPVKPGGLAEQRNAAGTTLTVTGAGVPLALGTPVSIEVSGLTNTYIAGSYGPEIVTSNSSGLVDSGVAPAEAFSGPLAVGASASLSWSGKLTGYDQLIPDTDPADEELEVYDPTGTGAGWNVTVSATDFTDGTGYSLPAPGVLQVTGSVTDAALRTAPTASCQGTLICSLPDDSSVTYPVAITSAAPTGVTVYAANTGTGVGPVAIGGADAPNPFGWWLNVPALVQAGTYTSTLTVTVASGP